MLADVESERMFVWWLQARNQNTDYSQIKFILWLIYHSNNNHIENRDSQGDFQYAAA